MYLIYVSTIDVQLKYKYADDHALQVSFNDQDRAKETIIKSIDSLQYRALSVKDWINKNYLKMNSSKLNYVFTLYIGLPKWYCMV